jgi:hypothetical protein
MTKPVSSFGKVIGMLQLVFIFYNSDKMASFGKVIGMLQLLFTSRARPSKLLGELVRIQLTGMLQLLFILRFRHSPQLIGMVQLLKFSFMTWLDISEEDLHHDILNGMLQFLSF